MRWIDEMVPDCSTSDSHSASGVAFTKQCFAHKAMRSHMTIARLLLLDYSRSAAPFRFLLIAPSLSIPSFSLSRLIANSLEFR
jgi:hypothetical protein